jgi:hypothetical protein
MAGTHRRPRGRNTRWQAITAVLLIGVALAYTGGVSGAAAPHSAVVPPPPATLPRRVGFVPATDGHWAPRITIRGRTVMWVTQYHPLVSSPGTVATGVVIDQTTLRGALFNGPTTPGGCCWKNGSTVMAAARPALVTAFNGGFQFEHMFQSGYKTEGRVMKRLQPGDATLAISKTGVVKVGLLGIDVKDDGTWMSLRQNLPAVVMNGKSVVYTHSQGVWGGNFGNVMVTNRSAICTRADGRLMYVFAGGVDIYMFAGVLVWMGCKFAMELDINGTWPQIAVYKGFGTKSRSGVLLDNRMDNANRFLTGSSKDFIAFFDRTLLPARVVA